MSSVLCADSRLMEPETRNKYAQLEQDGCCAY